MNDAPRPFESDDAWSVFDFARRYRLAKEEENRLLTLYGPSAPFRVLLENARRYSSASSL